MISFEDRLLEILAEISNGLGDIELQLKNIDRTLYNRLEELNG